jgi:thymidylate synthase ThyX
MTAKILADSISPAGKRLVTYEITIPKFCQAELNTHRMLSRNSASSRAIPVEKVIEQVKNDCVKPVHWGKAQPGMQAREELTGDAQQNVEEGWYRAARECIREAQWMLEEGAHKQLVNRILEPWMKVKVVVSATEWDGFFRQRCHKDAQPELRVVAEAMRALYDSNVPAKDMMYHTPYVSDEEWRHKPLEQILRVSAARCARVSYNGTSKEWDQELALAEKLTSAGHWSPFEHVAMALRTQHGRSGNFYGWQQLRQIVDPFFYHG